MTTPQTELTIREFRPGDESAFLKLNQEWITRYFAIEPRESELLADPQGMILDRGGKIFFAVRDNQTIGCCALLVIAPGEFEVAKMTVAESARGNGIGRSLLERVIAEAHALGAHRLYLETNSKLTPAIRLYESLGFRNVTPGVPSPYVRADVFMEMLLG